MATKLYLHNATTTDTGTLPAAATSVSATSPSQIASGGDTNRHMDIVIGASQQSLVLTTLANTNAQPSLVGRWVTKPLASQTFALTTIGDIVFHIGGSESNAQSNFQVRIVLVQWTPSSGTRGTRAFDLATNATAEPGTTQTALNLSNAAGGTSITFTDQDILVLEVWRDSTVQAAGTARTNTIFFDGTTEDSITTNAAYVSFPNDTLKFAPQAYGQTQADIKNQNRGYGQPQADIKAAGLGSGQSQTQILKSAGYGQTQAKILKSAGYGQAITLVNGSFTDPITDTFTRTVSNAIGGPIDSGDTWVFLSGDNTKFSVDGSKLIAITRAGDDKFALNSTLVTKSNIEVLFTASLDKIPSSGTIGFEIASNLGSSDIDGSFGLAGGVSINSAGNIKVNPSSTTVGSYIAGDIWNIKIHFLTGISGGKIGKIKGWKSTDPEPGWANIIIVGNTKGSPGHVLLTKYSDFATANTPLTWNIDNLSITQAWPNEAGQAQADIKATSFGSGQSQADIKTIGVTAFGQAQCKVIAGITAGIGQAQADIKQTYFGLGQAQADIKAQGFGLGQANADIKATNYGLGQAQTDIKTQGFGLGQAQTDIKTQGFGLGQSNSDIKTQGFGLGQSQADIKAASFGLGQSNSDIKARGNGLGQTQADIKAQGFGLGQAQSDIKTQGFGFGQSNADIKTISFGLAQAQTDIKTKNYGLAQATTRIKGNGALVYVQDSFSRSNSTSWQSPDIGPAYRVFIETDSIALLSTTGTEGTITGDFSTLSFAKTLTNDISISERVDTQIDFKFAKTGNYADNYFEISLRNDFEAATSAVVAYVSRDPISSEIGWYAYTPPDNSLQDHTHSFTVDFDTYYTLKLRVYDQKIYVKIWNRINPEPDWLLQQDLGFIVTGNSNYIYIRFTGPDSSNYNQTFVDNYSVHESLDYQTGQAQADIKAKNYGFGQAQSDIKAPGFGFGQAQTDIKATGFGLAQTQADIKQIGYGSGQSQTDIKHTYFGLGQAQVTIVGNAFGQANTDVKTQGYGSGQATAAMLGAVQKFAQTQTDIKATNFGLGQANSDIKVTSKQFAQTQTDIKQTYIQCAQAQANIKTTYFGLGQTQCDIKQIYPSYAQANTDIKQTNNSFGQSQADIKTQEFNSGQTQAHIRLLQLGFGQAQSDIQHAYTQNAQAQCDIKITSSQNANAQAIIRSTVNGCGQAQCMVLTNKNGYGQAQVDIKQIGIGFGQAQCVVSLDGLTQFAQTQALIVKGAGYAQAQGLINQPHTLKFLDVADRNTLNLEVKDRAAAPIIVLNDREATNFNFGDRNF